MLHLPSWQAIMLLQGGRLVVVKSVLVTIPIYAFMALDTTAWVIKAIDKRQRAFLWKGTDNVTRGHCLVACPAVCKPTEFRGLGLHNRLVLGNTLRIQWLWL